MSGFVQINFLELDISGANVQTGYLTFVLDEAGFRWYSLPSAIFAALMTIGIIGMFSESAKTSDAAENDHPA